MSHMTDKIRDLIVTHAPYSPDTDPWIVVYTDTRQHKSTVNTQYKLPELCAALTEILEYVEALEAERDYNEQAP